MKIRDYMMTGAVCVMATAMQVFAQVDKDADEADPVVTDNPVGGIGQDAEASNKGFELLVRAESVRGEVQVLNPDVGTSAPVVKKKAYPLGSVFRTGKGASMALLFSATEYIELLENTEVVVLASKDDPKARSVRLVSGQIKTFLKDTLAEGQFSVESANVRCKNLAGNGRFSLTMDGEAENFQAATIRGTAYVEGDQYTIEALRAANTVSVLTTPNRALSRLTSVKGDFKITLDNGTAKPVEYDMSPQAVVKIMRDAAPVGGRQIVSTLVMSPTGKARHHFTYAVGRGDIVVGETIDPDAEQPDAGMILVPTAEKEKKAKPAPEAKKNAKPAKADAGDDDDV